MRNQILSFIFLFSLTGLFAQVQEVKAPMSRGSHPALSVVFENTKGKDVESLWVKYARNLNAKTDKIKRTDEYMTNDAMIKGMSANTVDVYAMAKEEGADVRFYLWFDLGGAFLDSKMHGAQAGEGRRIIEDFAQEFRVNELEDAIKDQENVVKRLEKDLSGFEKDQQNAEKTIADCEKKIENAREAIKEAGKNQATARGEIKSEQGKLKELESALKKVKKN